MILLFVDSIVVVVAPILPKVVAVGDITGVRELFVSLPNKGGGVLTFMRLLLIFDGFNGKTTFVGVRSGRGGPKDI